MKSPKMEITPEKLSYEIKKEIELLRSLKVVLEAQNNEQDVLIKILVLRIKELQTVFKEIL